MNGRRERNSLTNGLSGVAIGSPVSDESELEHERNGAQNRHNGKSNADGIAISEVGICALCGKQSVCKCERCGDFYCSPQCQRKDWPSHRYICFPMPRLVKVGQSNNVNDALPVLKSEGKSVEMTKEESRQAYKARQLSYIPTTTTLPKEGSTVVLTGFKSSNRCYVRPADKSTTEEYYKILKKIDNFGKHASDMNGVPKANTFAVAQRNEKWCRVQILSAKPDNRIRIHFIDYGTISIIQPRELRRIAGSVSSLPCYIHMVQLHGVTMYSMEAKLLQQLSEYTNKEFRMEVMDPDDKGGNIQLYHIDTNNLLNSEIIQVCQNCSETEIEPGSNTSTTSYGNEEADNEDQISKEQITDSGLTSNASTSGNANVDESLRKSDTESNKQEQIKNNKSPTGKKTESPCMVPPFKTTQFDANAKNFKVIVVDASYVRHGYIGCILESDCDNFKAVLKFLKNFDGIGEPYKPKLSEYCLAQFESEWYRATVLEILEDKFRVSYIDFANESELDSASIRPYPMDLKLPCCTNICAIAELPVQLSSPLVEFLETELDGYKRITVDSLEVVDDITFIVCKELLKKLRDCKLL